MNLLIMTDSFLPHAGGSRVYYYNLYSRIAERHPDRITILTKKVPGWRHFDAGLPGALRIIRRFRPLPDHHVRQLPKLVFPMAEAFLRALAGRIDLVHAGDLYPPGVVALSLKKALGIPYLAYCHGEDITLTENRRFQFQVRNRIYRHADAVVAACEFARQKLLELGIPEEKIVKITPGVDCERFAPRPRKEELVRRYGLENRRVLMTVARLAPRKGHAAVLQALAKVLPDAPDVVYLILGVGPERQKLEQLAAELHISHAVRFVGYISESDLGDFYNLCDLFIMMNQELRGDIEGFGMVFLEASAAGKPVIGGRSGGTADSIQDGVTGLLVDPQSDGELVATLRLLLDSPELRQRLGDAGRERARSEFSWEMRAEKLRELSRAIVADRNNQLPAERRFAKHGSSR